MTQASPFPLARLLRELYPPRLPRLPGITARLYLGSVQLVPVRRITDAAPEPQDGWGEIIIGEVYDVPGAVYADRPGLAALPCWVWA